MCVENNITSICKNPVWGWEGGGAMADKFDNRIEKVKSYRLNVPCSLYVFINLI